MPPQSDRRTVRTVRRSDTEQRDEQKLPAMGEVFNPYGMFNGVWVPESLLKCSDICVAGRLLFGLLARFAGRDGRCFPSVETLAKEMGMSARQIQRLLTKLCRAGFLRRDPQYRSNGSQRSNAYYFLYHSSLAPAIAVATSSADLLSKSANRLTKGGGDTDVTPPANVTPGTTEMSPLEEIQSNSRIENSSSSLPEPEGKRPAAAADPLPTQYPKSTARFRDFFPRTTDSVIGRIVRAISDTCPDATDEDIAAVVYVAHDQHSPGLWVNTMPLTVQLFVQHRKPKPTHPPKCSVCKDGGLLWDEGNRPSWCPAACAAAKAQRDKFPAFVDEWRREFAEEPRDGVAHR